MLYQASNWINRRGILLLAYCGITMTLYAVVLMKELAILTFPWPESTQSLLPYLLLIILGWITFGGWAYSFYLVSQSALTPARKVFWIVLAGFLPWLLVPVIVNRHSPKDDAVTDTQDFLNEDG